MGNKSTIIVGPVLEALIRCPSISVAMAGSCHSAQLVEGFEVHGYASDKLNYDIDSKECFYKVDQSYGEVKEATRWYLNVFLEKELVVIIGAYWRSGKERAAVGHCIERHPNWTKWRTARTLDQNHRGNEDKRDEEEECVEVDQGQLADD
ncbi:hypothetical protein QL093DRAFT_2090782 [Fusarium oxysporum]|nr:hypothetical protein QL093DRAFT_2090782 [Fusarium oxysporum]